MFNHKIVFNLSLIGYVHLYLDGLKSVFEEEGPQKRFNNRAFFRLGRKKSKFI